MDFERKEVSASDAQLNMLAVLVTKLRDTENDLASKKEEMKEITKEIKRMSTKDIPDLMETIGMQSIETSDGLKVTIKENVYPSITEANKEAAYQWLQDNELGAIIKNKFEIVYRRGEGEQERAREFEALLLESGETYKRKEFIEAATLKKTVKDQLEDGGTFPDDLFSIYHERMTKIKE